MSTTPQTSATQRPVIFHYRAIPDYLQGMLAWRREAEPTFSVARETKHLYRCSPALVTRVLQGKRKLTPDRVGAFAKLLQLTAPEKTYLEQWVGLTNVHAEQQDVAEAARPVRRRRDGQHHLLSDWLNVYVKDAAKLEGFVPDAKVLYQLLGGIASVKHIDRSLKFLLREGYLRRTPCGKVVEDEAVMTATEKLPSAKISNFHKQTLKIARDGVDLYPLSHRWNAALVLTLNEQKRKELKELLAEFYERLLQFAEGSTDAKDELYQVLINLNPVGGSSNASQKS